MFTEKDDRDGTETAFEAGLSAHPFAKMHDALYVAILAIIKTSGHNHDMMLRKFLALTKRDEKLRVALHERVLDAVLKNMRTEGQKASARNRQITDAPGSHTSNETEADEAMRESAGGELPPALEDDGASVAMPKGHPAVAPSSSPAHFVPPSDARKKAEKEGAKRTAALMLTKKKTSDGRLWGLVGAHEIPGMERDGGIARQIAPIIASRAIGKRKYDPLYLVLSTAEFNAAEKAAVRSMYNV